MVGYRLADGATPQPVVIFDLQMPFFSMVRFMVLWSLAAIPALIILFGIVLLLAVLFGGLFGGLSHLRVPGGT